MKAYNLETARQHRDKITELYLHGLGISEWPSIVFELPQLQVLCLSENRLPEAPETLSRLTRLRALDLSGNLIQTLPASLHGLLSLEEVNLSGNRLSRFPPVLGKMPGLRKIDLSFNQFRSLPRHLGNAPGLVSLRLNRNRIKELPAEWGSMDRLQELQLDQNLLSSLPDWVGHLRNLRLLGLSQNKLRELPSDLSGLKMLGQLHLERNKLGCLPDALGNLSDLTEIDVRRNELEKLPDSIGRLRGLRRLLLDDNRLKELPAPLEKLQSLRLLSCQGNQLGEWPSFLGKLPRLEILEWGRNGLERIPDEPGKWPALERLGLQGNSMVCFPISLLGLPKLEKVTGLPNSARAMRFVQACRQSAVPAPQRRELFGLWQGDVEAHNLSKEALREGLRLALPSLRKSILSVLIGQSRAQIDPLRSAIGILGTTRLSRPDWKEKLEKAGLTYHETGAKAPSHAVLGGGILEIPAAWWKKGVAFMEESVLFQEVRDREQAYLQAMDDPGRLGRLLQSGQDASLRLSVSLLKNGGVPPSLMTDLYLAWRSVSDRKLKKELRDLLLLHTSSGGRRLLEKVRVIYSPEQIEEACRDSEFDPARIWAWWESNSR
ncbi:MAG: leucine-rich repeat domain-containing protein [Saprospirales bacterium]|nr:leucine-rich repeat domain-containing protein [Saprospirales bacterium]